MKLPPLSHDAALMTTLPSSQLNQMSAYHIKKIFKILVFILKIWRFQHHFSGNFNGWQNFFRDDRNEKTKTANLSPLTCFCVIQLKLITFGGIILIAITSLVLLDQASLTNSSKCHKM